MIKLIMMIIVIISCCISLFLHVFLRILFCITSMNSYVRMLLGISDMYFSEVEDHKRCASGLEI